MRREPEPDPTEVRQTSQEPMRLSTSAFALPERLRARADPALIARDERQFAAIAETAERLIAELSDRIDEARLSTGRKGQVAMERDQAIHRLTARRRTLRRFGLDMCLGHIVAADDAEPVYIGRFGLSDGQGRRLLIDWRAPAAEPFFAATHARPMGLTRRRRYRWTRGRVSDYWDEVFTADGLADPVETAALDDQSAFIASLATSRTPRMRDVLGTIQADQDAIIRAGSGGALVVDGGPGTGKTVVALHRAAYLLYADPRLRGGRSGVLFVGPHQHYLAYVSDVLPSLGEDGVQICTLRDLVPQGASAVNEADPEVARLKSSADMVRAIDARGAHLRGAADDPDDGGDRVGRDQGERRRLGRGLRRGRARHPAQRGPRDDPGGTARLADRARRADAPPDLLRKALRRNRNLHTTLDRAWTLVEAADLVSDLWSVPAYLRRCAPWLSPADVRRLQRSTSAEWTVSDLPLLDAARLRLGDPDASRRQRLREAALAAQRDQMDTVVGDLLEANTYDDGEGVWTMLRGEDLREALVDEGALPAIDPDRLAGTFAHVIVDEAQELTDAEWQMLLVRCPTRSFTIVGDRAQARHGFTESWRERLIRVGIDRIEVAPLSINYRTPVEIMVEAEPIIRAALPDANVPTSIRSTGVPVGHGPVSLLRPVMDDWLATPRRRNRLRHRRSHVSCARRGSSP